MTDTTQHLVLLAGAQEAARVGRVQSTVSRARQDPTHPVHTDPRTVVHQIGRHRYVLAPADAVDAWWAGRKTTPGPASVHETEGRS